MSTTDTSNGGVETKQAEHREHYWQCAQRGRGPAFIRSYDGFSPSVLVVYSIVGKVSTNGSKGDEPNIRALTSRMDLNPSKILSLTHATIDFSVSPGSDADDLGAESETSYRSTGLALVDIHFVVSAPERRSPQVVLL